jgi:RNA-directed DNA polymerase
MIPSPSVAHALADTMLAREATLAGLIASAAWSFEISYPWVPAMCEAILTRTGEHFYYFSREELADIILEDDGFYDAWEPGKAPPQIRRYCLELPVSTEQPAWLAALELPAFSTVGALASWFNLPPNDLGWFADAWRLDPAQSPKLNHYHYRWVEKRSGGWRLIEIPKSQLRLMQQKILRQILDLVPTHPAAHGFRRGHSCVTHAALHTGQRVVIRMDLKDFFPSVPASRVHAMFVKLGYSESVAGTLARLCVNRTPAGAFAGRSMPWLERQPYRTPHLPQGSPCSPALANLCAFRLDVRLHAFAESMGAVYSRYADDLVFSGDAKLERALDRFHVQVAAIALEEGFRVNTRKTRLMRAGTRQQVTGIVVNRHPNIARDEFDLLKAILTNCVRHGPASQNRDGRANFQAYLGGRVAYIAMVNQARGQRLKLLMDKIRWEPEAAAPS